MENGKFIVIEGSDGSGKATQLNLLYEYLRSKNLPVKTFDFPRYKDFSGKMVGRFLSGEFGELAEINPYLITYVYADDRLSAVPDIRSALENGMIVLSNRYATSNLAHQSARLPKAERDAFINFNLQLEYEVHNIPNEDLVIFLHVPYQISMRLLQNKDRAGRDYTHGKQVDIVEGNEYYLKNSEEVYLDLVDRFSHWTKIACVDDENKIHSREEIHADIVKVLKRRKLI